ncbi:MAG: hypothetical protein F4X57_13935 [Chloroflexi bacterium]|nr:hypothetical protein [Chloroflexota bacterium]
MNITLNIDEETVKKVRKIAIDKDTTLTEMVRDYLTWVAKGDALERQQNIAALDESFEKLSRDMGPRNWSREDLYAR